MEEKKSLWDWPFENKWKASAASIIYGPLIIATQYFYKEYQGEDVTVSTEELIEYSLRLGIVGYLANVYYLNMFSRIKRPRIINFSKALLSLGITITGSFLGNTKLTRYGERIFKEATNKYGSREELRIEASNQLREGNFPLAMELYTDYLDRGTIKGATLSERIIAPLVKAIFRAKTEISRSPRDMFAEVFVDLYLNDDERLFGSTWPRILQQQKDLEFRIIHAMFLSTYQRPEALDTWRKIEQEETLEQKFLGESRNEVYEFNVEHFKQVIIIKKNSKEERKLKREWNNLQAVQEALQGREKICAIGLTYYEESKEREVLIVKRRRGKNLEEFCKSEDSKEIKEEHGKRALANLAILHNLQLDAEEYSPIQELKRRVIERNLGSTREAELLLQTYREFYERKTQGERKISCHGDLYPSNVLEDGTIIDLETMCLANPWLDLETFLGAPQWEELNKEQMLAAYQEKKPLGTQGRDFYRVHTSLCQVGSFAKKAPETSQYYFKKLKETLGELQEQTLREKIEAYLQM